MISEKGQENDIYPEFRLGADDCLLLSARDVEIMSIVDHRLHQVCECIDHQILDFEYRVVDQESRSSLSKITTNFDNCTALLSISNQMAGFYLLIANVLHPLLPSVKGEN